MAKDGLNQLRSLHEKLEQSRAHLDRDEHGYLGDPYYEMQSAVAEELKPILERLQSEHEFSRLVDKALAWEAAVQGIVFDPALQQKRFAKAFQAMGFEPEPALQMAELFAAQCFSRI